MSFIGEDEWGEFIRTFVNGDYKIKTKVKKKKKDDEVIVA